MIQMTILLALLPAIAGDKTEVDTKDIHAPNARSHYDKFQNSPYYQHLLTEDEDFKRHSQASLSRERRSAQPIHRSILAHRRRSVLRANNDDGTDGKRTVESDAVSISTLRLKSRILNDVLNPSPAGEATSIKEASGHNQATTGSSEGGYLFRRASDEPEPPSAILTSPWWVRIDEDSEDSHNFVPTSRRAASSAVYTLRTVDREEKEGRDLLRDRRNASNSKGGDLLLKKEGDSTGNLSTTTKSTTSDNDAVVMAPLDNANATIHGDTKGRVLNDKENRQSKTINNATNSQQNEEYMIISGGYTDHDWKTFPVYAFPLTSSARTGSGEWIDLSPLPTELAGDSNTESWCTSQDNVMARDRLYKEAKYLNVNVANQTNTTYDDPWAHADPCAPSGRMGHSSFVYNDYLYVFGGLIYDAEQTPTESGNKESFRLEDVPYMYRLDLKEMFEARKVPVSSNNRHSQRRSEDASLIQDLGTDVIGTFETLDSSSESSNVMNTSNRSVKGWQRIIPRVKPFLTYKPNMAAAEVLLKSINRGEMKGGLWNGKFVMYGGLWIALLDEVGPHASSTVMKGPSHTAGGSSQIGSHTIEFPLGDVWAYDIEMDAFEKITNAYGKAVSVEQSIEDYYDDNWLREYNADLFPRPRTAHAAVIVGDKLVIHGGIGWNSPVGDWEIYEDLWMMDLTTLEWKQRHMLPSFPTSYHSLAGCDMGSLMGWGRDFVNFTSWDGPVVAAFGGYTNRIDIFTGEVVTYVSHNLIVSFPAAVEERGASGGSSWWLKANNPDESNHAKMIGNRFEHVAVMSNEIGSMFIWGGQFQDTSNVKGVWMMNLVGRDSRVTFELAEYDGFYDLYWETRNTFRTVVIMVLFLSMTLKFLLGLRQRYNEVMTQQPNEDAALRTLEDFAAQHFASAVAPTHRRKRGLHPHIISTIQEKIYCSNENNNSSVEEEQDSCCPICLVDYTDGDALRVLPCGHYMHKTCVDAWLNNNPSCPSCRHCLCDLVDDRTLVSLQTLRSRLPTSRSSVLSQMRLIPGSSRMRNSQGGGSDDGSNEVEMAAQFFDEPVFDLHVVSALEFSEDGTELSNEHSSIYTFDAGPAYISRRSRRERTSRLARFRRDVAVMRRNSIAAQNGTTGSVPLTELLHETIEIPLV